MLHIRVKKKVQHLEKRPHVQLLSWLLCQTSIQVKLEFKNVGFFWEKGKSNDKTLVITQSTSDTRRESNTHHIRSVRKKDQSLLRPR